MGTSLKISYDKLLKLLIDKKLNKQMLTKMTKISSTTMTKISNNESVNLKVLMRICEALDCDIGDILEFKKEDQV